MLALFLLLRIALATYCASGPLNQQDASLGFVGLMGNTKGITNPSSGCPNPLGVQNLTYLQADLSRGVKYTIEFNVATCGFVYFVFSGVWIDYNQNNIYESSELVYNASGYGWHNVSFVVPHTALMGTTRMRVQSQESGPESGHYPLDPCANFTWGGTKDFGIIIAADVYCESGPTSTKDTNLGYVFLAGYNGTRINDTSDCPGVIGVQDKTNMSVTLFRNATYPIIWNVTTCGLYYLAFSAAWIDYNQNKVYDSNELLYNVSGYGYKNGSFSVPHTALIGTTRIRVQVQEGYVYPLNPCQEFDYGGTKDFSIVIADDSPPPPPPPPPANYCSSGPTTTVDTNLGSVFLDGYNSTWIHDTSDCPGAAGVQDKTNITVTLALSGHYIIAFNSTTCGNPFVAVGAAWIDYNHNSVFDSYELLFNASGYGMHNGSFTVPLNASLGTTRLRVQVQETNAYPLNPCANFAYGGTKDFGVVIVNATVPPPPPPPPANYCSSGPTTTEDTNLGLVFVNGYNSTWIHDTSDCPGVVGVQDKTNITVTLALSGNYTILFNSSTCRLPFSAFGAAWIDYNHNNVFDHPYELLFNASGYGIHNGSFTVPLNASLGTTRLRVQVQETPAFVTLYPLNPCADFAYGGTKDFGVVIVNATVPPPPPPPPPANYCSSGPSTTVDTNLGLVVLDGYNSTWIHDTSDCPGIPGVQDKTNITVTLALSGKYTIAFNSTTCGNPYSAVGAAWIDYNHNNVFDSYELLFNASGYGMHNGSFTVPLNASLGTTRMRVQVQETTSYPLNPCASFPYGGTKDFGVVIVNATVPPPPPPPPPANYCSSGPTLHHDTDLGGVFLFGTNSSINDTSNCTGATGVQDFTSKKANLERGKNYTVHFDTTSCGAMFNVTTAIWIDYNQNQVFDSSELVYNVTGYGLHRADFIVPYNAHSGTTRMRIQAQESHFYPLNPCQLFAWGGTKDFGIIILNNSFVADDTVPSSSHPLMAIS